MAFRQATLQDFMKPEFVGQNPEDYEVREDGAVVRKDRWEMAVRNIAGHLGIDWGFETAEVVQRVRECTIANPDRAMLLRLARQALWVAYVWNDHNHDKHPKLILREEAKNLGIEDSEDAEAWLVKVGAWKKSETENEE